MLKSKSVLRFAFLVCGSLFLSYQDASASHIVGGDLTYRCLGGDMYEIRLVVRRDCFLGDTLAQFDDPAAIGFFDGVTNQLLTFINGGQLLIPYNADDTLNETLVSDCSVISGDVCVHTTVYVGTIMLPYRATGYKMSYLRCCRNESLTNVLNPDDTGMTLIAELSAEAQEQCNSSPQFGPYPPIYTCVNKEINFLHSAFDAAGDSLVYSLCTPYAGGTRTNNRPQPPPPPPYDNIVFRPPYSLANLMGGVPLTIDPATGQLTGIPNTVGQFVIGICVSAYKDGVLTGMTRRDFQINVRMCRDVPVANFSAPALSCEGLTVTFDNQSILSDEYLWLFDFPNTNLSSTEFEPTFTFPVGDFYDVALIVNDSNEFCFDTIIHRIGVFDSQIVADFTYDVTSCTEDGVVVVAFDNSSGADPGFPIDTWAWALTVNGNLYTSSVQNPVFPPIDIDQQETAILTLVVTSTNGCSAMTAATFPITEIVPVLNAAADSICRGDTVQLLLVSDCSLDYTWSPNDFIGEECNPLVSPDSSITYSVTITDGLCEVDTTIHIDVQQLPSLAFDYETDCRSLVVIFDNNSVGGVLYHWDFGVTTSTTDTTRLENPTFTYPEPGEYTVTLSSRDGCDVSVTDVITANAITETLEDTTINCFRESIQLNPDYNPNYTYVWSPAEFLNFPNIGNPLATVEDDTTFCVTISQASLPGCEIVECIDVIVPDEFEVTAGGDITSCKFEEITLTATSAGDVTFKWIDITGQTVIGMGPTIIVLPDTTTSYIVIATDSLGCSKRDTVTVNRPPPGFIVEAFSDTTYCNIQTITLIGQSIPGVKFEWFNSSGELVGEGPTVDVTPGSPTYFVVIGTDPLDCQNSDTVHLTPVFFDLTISGDQNICLEENTIVTITDNSVPPQDLMYTWYPVETIVGGAGTDTAIVDPPVTTTYCVIVKNNELGCIDSSNCTTVTVDIFDPFPVTITADPNDPQVINTPIQLTVNQPPSFTYVWSSNPPADPPIPNIYNPVVTPTVINTTYSVTVTNEGGCTATASFAPPLVDPPCTENEIFIPEAFTPNGDGENDILFVRGNFINTMEIHIYNRWGQEVFKSFNQSDGWDGTFEGKELPPDVFGYYMDIGCPNDKTYFKKGNVTLLK